MRSDRDWRRLLLRAAVLAFFAVVFEWLNLLGIPEATHQLGATAFFRAVAPLEGGVSAADEPVVLLFDERSLKVLNASWPLDFEEHAAFLKTLIGYHPRAIFYDITFYQRRDGVPEFQKAIQLATKATDGTNTHCDRDGLPRVPGIPVFLAQTANHAPPLDELCDAGAQSALVSWTGDPDTYPLQACREGGRKCQPGKRCGQDQLICYGRMDMAATLLWREWCRSNKCANAYDADKATALFDIVWRTQGNKDQDDLLQGATNCLSVGQELALAFTPSQAAGAICPQALIAPAASLMMCDDSVAHCQNKAALRRAIAGHVVIIGAQLPGLRDQLFSPLFGPIPGVYVHAAAFANLVGLRDELVVHDENYFDDAGESFFSLSIARSFLLIFVSLAVLQLYLEWVNGLSVPIAETSELEITPLRWFFHRRVVRFHERMDWLRVAAYAPGPPHLSVIRNSLATLLFLIIAVAIALVVALLFSLFMYEVLRQSPVRWVGEAVLVVTLSIPEVAATAVCAIVQPLLFFASGRLLLRVFLDPPKKEPDNEDIVEDDIIEIAAPGAG